MREAVTQCQRLSLTLRYLVTGDNLVDLKVIRDISQSIWIIVQETCLVIGRQKLTTWIVRNTAHSLFRRYVQYIHSTQHVVQPFNIASGAPLARGGDIHCF
jgi:hypothetical protein